MKSQFERETSVPRRERSELDVKRKMRMIFVTEPTVDSGNDQAAVAVQFHQG